MLKSLAALLLLLAFSAQTFNKALIELDYYVNTSAFAKNCENKAKPMMHCNGKCQMMKKLKEEEKKDHQNPERKMDNKNEVVWSSSSFASIELKKIQVPVPGLANYISYCPQTEPVDIFHPPA